MTDLIRKPASSSTGGELTDGAQTIPGDKTFTGNVTIQEASSSNLGLVKKPVIVEDITTTAWSTSNTDYASVTLTPGTWVLASSSYHGANSTARSFSMHIATTTGGGSVTNGTHFRGGGYDGTTGTATVQLNSIIVTVATNTIYKLSGSSSSVSGLSQSTHRLTAIRLYT
jgi:hypothetical protein